MKPGKKIAVTPVPVHELPHEPWLTLIGLRLVWDRNAGPGAAAGGSGGAGARGGAQAVSQETDVPPGAIAGNLRA